MNVPEWERQSRYLGERELIWENDIAWKRKNLNMDGEIDSPSRGRWRLTKVAIEKVEKSREKWRKLEELDKRKEALREFEYFTDELVDWLIKIANDEPLDLQR